MDVLCAGCEWAVCSNGRHVVSINHDGGPTAEPEEVSSASMDPVRCLPIPAPCGTTLSIPGSGC